MKSWLQDNYIERYSARNDGKTIYQNFKKQDL